jgi:hypothetical protein
MKKNIIRREGVINIYERVVNHDEGVINIYDRVID